MAKKAKKFNDIYLEAKETVYNSAATASVMLASLNSSVIFTPILRPEAKTGDLTSSPQYSVQRKKRPSVNVVANATSGSTSAALAALDQLSSNEYETLEVATGALKSVGFKSVFGDDYDFGLNPQHLTDMKYQVGEIAAQRHKDLIALLKTANKTGTALPLYKSGETKVWDAIADEVIKLAAIDDTFKDVQNQSDFVIYTSREVAKSLTKEMGIAFNQETPIAQTGFISKMGINGTPVIIDARLQGNDVIIAHREALGFKSEPAKKDFSIDLGLTAYTGQFFYDVMAIIDEKRITQIGA